MKKYRVSTELKPYIRKILIQSYHSCRMSKDDDGQEWCETDASSGVFHRIVQRAKCEKATDETGVFQVTAKEAANEYRLNMLLDQANATSYQIIDDKDGIRRTRYV